MSVQSQSYQNYVRNVVIAMAAAVLLFWTVFPFFWILLTSLKGPGDMLSVPPAKTISARPSIIFSAARMIARNPEPQAWLTVNAGTLSGAPARKVI